MSVDKATRIRLLLALAAQTVSKVCYSAIQLIQVPVFLHFWSANVYGEWLALSALPNYLIFSNFGFGSVALHEMTMLVAQDDTKGALRVFQSCWWLIITSLSVAGCALWVGLHYVPIGGILNIHHISQDDARHVILYLGMAVLLGQLEALLGAGYRSIGRNAFGMILNSATTIASFAATMVPVCLGYGPRTAALVFACSNMAGTVILAVMVLRDVPWMRLGWSEARFSEIRRMTLPALAFLGLPMSLALNIQGTVLVVSHLLGPIAVVIFTTARTISRIALQLVQMINVTFEPEFSRTFAQQNWQLIRTLHRRACQSALFFSCSIVAILILGGPYLLSHWTQGKVPPSRPLLSILLAVVILYSLWQTSSSILLATNQHKKFALVSMAANLFTVGVTWLATRSYGLYGAAASLFTAEILMILWVLPNTLRMVRDTLPAFAAGMFDVPSAFHPQVLLRRLRRMGDSGLTDV